MSQYTELLNTWAETLSIDDDDFEDKLLDIARLFRGFSEALTAFIAKHGYTGDLGNAASKARFLSSRFREAGIRPLHSFRALFSPNAEIERETAYKICFALGLGVDETNEFFKCVQFERSFDCHTIREAVYYFCIKNNRSYSEAEAILARIPVPKKVKTIPGRGVLYTGAIIDCLDSIKDSETLIQYISDNINDFQYNNVTAIQDIRELWSDISKADGLAVKEGAILDKAFNRFVKIDLKKEQLDSNNEMDRLRRENLLEERKWQEQNVKPEDYVVAYPGASIWIIFSQILGLANYQESKYAMEHDRSLASVLSGNKLMPLKTAYCFPSRQNIEKLIRGELVGDNEIVRKMLIFLTFYTYWAKIIIGQNDAFYKATPSDRERCFDTINNRLYYAGYPDLYAGNPYDWLFMWALNNDTPLEAFRYYMGEVFAERKEEENY